MGYRWFPCSVWQPVLGNVVLYAERGREGGSVTARAPWRHSAPVTRCWRERERETSQKRREDRGRGREREEEGVERGGDRCNDLRCRSLLFLTSETRYGRCNDLWLQLMTVSLCDGLIRRMYVERERENSAHERGRAYFARPSRVSQLSLALGHVSLPLITRRSRDRWRQL